MVNEVLLVITDEYADWEAAMLAAAIDSKADDGTQKYFIKTVSLTHDPIRSIGGFTVLPDYSVEDVPDDYAALILIGGDNWRKPESMVVKQLVEDAAKRDILIGGICDGSVFLGMIGMLNEVKHTSNELEDLQAAAGEAYTNAENYVHEQAVIDGNIVTANGSAYLEFTREILLWLDVAPSEEVAEWYDFYKLGYIEMMKREQK
ncbi:type 1 glutamine amidotransferase family protein [Culicoidibacter larvae]|uniref:Glutamine amidotransferase n=1 Tax=Culicoidibacter larvae TaxID=2579976 RepID=A0A5R8QE92_9FIRM|nr:type 1 glutamine amidotransferase family protein [Culicoidibacter larvae]TLG75286.1 glutamine amidotransferase [Culicoidibacter larvae]